VTRTLRVVPVWGTSISIDVRGRVDPQLLDDLGSWFDRVDDIFSTWRTDSEISRLARGELHLDEVSQEMLTVFEMCADVCEQSRGAFDIRVGSDPRVTKREGLGPIDPSGLVKGWALDRAADDLRHAGVDDFAIIAGGDIVVAGNPAEDQCWRIGIQHPWQRDAVAAVVEVSEAGVATSGRYERGDHVIDPRTGEPATTLMSVTVVAPELAVADGYATAGLVLGHDAMPWLTEELDLPAMVIDAAGTVHLNQAFADIRRPPGEGRASSRMADV
jgi:FAD:protein FMN transferase